MSLATEKGFVSENSAAMITYVDTVEQLADAIQVSRLSQNFIDGDNFGWSVLSPSHGKYSNFKPLINLLQLILF